MNAAAVFAGKYESSSYLPPSVLYDVASPAFPSDVKDDVLQRLQPGERPDVHALVVMVKRAKQESRQRRQMERASADSPRMHAAPRLKGHEQEAAASQLQNEHHAIGVAADDVRAAADMIVRRFGENLDDLLQVLGEHASITRQDLIAASARASRQKGLSEAHARAVTRTPGLPKDLDRMVPVNRRVGLGAVNIRDFARSMRADGRISSRVECA